MANADDAQAIHRILQATWGESLLFDVFTDHVSSPEHQVFVAVDGSEIVGFLSAFLVPSPAPRWEIDLIIVRSKSQGKGIGTSLIEEALTYGSHLGARWTKASIRIDNYASQSAFSKAGLRRTLKYVASSFGILWLASPQPLYRRLFILSPLIH